MPIKAICKVEGALRGNSKERKLLKHNQLVTIASDKRPARNEARSAIGPWARD